ncbi:hypothetical protein, partial [Teichococcus wenyumeiae]
MARLRLIPSLLLSSLLLPVLPAWGQSSLGTSQGTLAPPRPVAPTPPPRVEPTPPPAGQVLTLPPRL